MANDDDDAVRERAIDAAVRVFDRRLLLVAPPRVFVAEALDAAGEVVADEIRRLRAQLKEVADLASHAYASDAGDSAGRAAIKDTLHTIATRARQATRAE